MLQCEHWLLCKQTRIVNQPIKMFTNTFTRVVHSWCKIKELDIINYWTLRPLVF